MPIFTFDEICVATGGRLFNYSGDSEGLSVRQTTSVSTDTRDIRAGALFVALKGERFDGHRFCQIAADKGAALLLVSDCSNLPSGLPYLLVSDTLLALGQIAKYYRIRLGCKVIGVTGSVGKTSTRRMIESVFGKSMKTHATKDNNNNEIGLPMTILSAPEDVELIILEMGMRLKGEISYLTHIAMPDVAVISNIGVAHIERLGSKEAILEAKLEICEGLINEKLLVINGEDSLLSQRLLKSGEKTWGELGVAFSAVNLLEDNPPIVSAANQVVKLMSARYFESGSEFLVRWFSENEEQEISFRLNVAGQHHVNNALLAILCALHFDVSVQAICEGLEEFSVLDGRGKLLKLGRYLIYDDAYNAGPESMAASFDSLKLLAPNSRRVAAVGGMLELGDYAKQYHFEAGIAAAKSGLSLIAVCGQHKDAFIEGVRTISTDIQVIMCEDKDEMVDVLAQKLQPEDALLIKASHAFGFHTLASELLNKINENQIKSEANK
ncbi:MAG: UDP-N-acetylmuramoyl-tripeptide--D-alanyl-D-alanine ligase [Clostridiaceae bacterium]|nr:UDP-N-acetylmuramoyl-tripeptide--D-alanyl-D-alanine ligase [Clostridiaceae bacterium]